MARYVPGLKIYGFTNSFTLVPAPPFIPPHGTCLFAVSYSWRALWQFQPHQTLPQPLLLLAVPTTTQQHSNSPREALAAGSQCSVPGHLFHPWLSQPFTSSACRSMCPTGLWCRGAADMNMQQNKAFLFF